jgi:hypothetical protein
MVPDRKFEGGFVSVTRVVLDEKRSFNKKFSHRLDPCVLLTTKIILKSVAADMLCCRCLLEWY